MKYSVLAFLVIFCGVHMASPSPVSSNEEKVLIPSHEFTLDLYKVLRLKTKTKDVFYSPWSVAIGLTMLLNGACKETASEIQNALRLSSQDLNIINSNIGSMFENLQGNEVSYVLESVNKVYVNGTFPLKQGYVDVMNKYYSAPPEQQDFFNKNEEARQSINQLVANKTRQLIPEFIKKGFLNRGTILYLLNVIYFSGKWVIPFPKEDTKSAQFTTVENREVQVPMMRLKADLKAMYDTELDVDSVLLPYQGNRLQMLILVPRQTLGILDLEQKLNSAKLKDFLDKNNRLYRTNEVILYLPKFEVEATYELKEELKKMGITRAFAGADFTKITNDSLEVSSVSHKAVLKVHEEGSEAAAVTGIQIVLTSLIPSTVIRADHPFMLFIHDSTTDAILFGGAVMNP